MTDTTSDAMLALADELDERVVLDARAAMIAINAKPEIWAQVASSLRAAARPAAG